MKFLDEIKKQPQHIREIMFSLCVITSISLVGMVWFNSTQSNMYALLNPGEKVEDKFFAKDQNSTTLFGYIGQAGRDLKATVYGIFNLKTEVSIKAKGQNDNVGDKTYLLPLPGNK